MAQTNGKDPQTDPWEKDTEKDNETEKGSEKRKSRRDDAAIIDDEVVFFKGERNIHRKKDNQHVALFITAILAIAVVVALGIVFLLQQNNNSKPKTAPYVPTTLAPETTPTKKKTKSKKGTSATDAVDTTSTHAAQSSTIPPTEAPTDPPTTAAATVPTTQKTDDEKLMDYANESGLIDALKAVADENMTVTVTAEQGMLMVRYTISLDSQDSSQQPYFDSLKGYFDSLSTQLDKPVYEMRERSGVSNAVLQLDAVDKNGNRLYSSTVD